VDKHNKFSKSGGARSAPKGTQEIWVEIDSIDTSIDKEWIKRLLDEFNEDLQHDFGSGTTLKNYIDNFLKRSKVWNEK